MTDNLLTLTKKAFESVRSSVVVAMQYLYTVREEGAWKEVASSFSEYVESELGISQGFASKLLAVNQHYLIEGGLSPENIAETDYECLYLAAKTEGTPEEQVAKARTLTRRELKEERVDAGHVHGEEIIQIYKCCGMRVPDHA